MTRLTIPYGHPTDPAEFDRYYHEVHIPRRKDQRPDDKRQRFDR